MLGKSGSSIEAGSGFWSDLPVNCLLHDHSIKIIVNTIDIDFLVNGQHMCWQMRIRRLCQIPEKHFGNFGSGFTQKSCLVNQDTDLQKQHVLVNIGLRLQKQVLDKLAYLRSKDVLFR